MKLLEETNFPTFGLQRALFTGKPARRTGILDYLINVEVNRRRRLQALVIDHLAQSHTLRFLEEDRLLDANALDAVSALRKHNVSIPASLSFGCSSRTVYHLSLLTTSVAEAFWKAGFRDINEPDCDGNTPLMAHYSRYTENDCLDLIDWFEGKGVNVDETVEHIHSLAFFSGDDHPALCPCSISGHTVLHVIAKRVSFGVTLWPRWSDSSLKTFQRILHNEKQDACKCACSLAGCRAVIVVIKSWSWKTQGFKLFFPKRILLRKWSSRFLLFCLVENIISEEITRDVIRFLTFDALGLTHTCCRPKPEFSEDLIPFEDGEEIQEIHDEEREDLQLLEDLLMEFNEYRRKSNCSIRDFYFTYWRSRMKEVLSEGKVWNQDNLREIGVSLHTSSQRQRWTFVDMFDELVNELTNGLIEDKVQKSLTDRWISNLSAI